MTKEKGRNRLPADIRMAAAARSASRPIRLIIQIPCYNEEKTLARTLRDLPRELPGVDRIEWLVVNDGSSDRTVEVARAAGADHVLDLPCHAGLARAFTAGLEHAVELGADIIVNTDADNQYDAGHIPALIAPILERRAELVVGNRPIPTLRQFSPFKRGLQRLGSQVVRLASHADIEDAPSGFRAISRDAALRINVFDRYTYTLETLIQAGLSGIRITSVPITVHARLRPSRLVRSSLDYVRRSVSTIVRVLLIYEPGRVFFLLGLPPFLAGLVLVARWLWLRAGGMGGDHASSLILAVTFVVLGALAWVAGLLGELSAINRRLLQDIQYMLRRERAEASHGREEEG